MKAKINVGLVGYKFMGKAHSNALNKLGMFFDLDAEIVRKAICGRDKDAVAAASKTLGWESYETCWEALLAREDIHAVDITTPTDQHKEIAIAAAKSKKHVFCEKPLALDTKDAREILAAVEESGVKHQIGFNYRFAPAIALAKKMIDEGKLGKIYHFRGKYLQDFILDPSFPLIWRLDKNLAGSGSHGDLGAHVIDLARYLAGDFKGVMGLQKTFIKERPIVKEMTGLSASAQTGTTTGPVTVDDATVFVAEFENGALGTFEATRFAAGHSNDMSFEINGSRGSLRFDLLRLNELEYFSVDDEPGTKGFRNIQVTESLHQYANHWWPPGHVIGYEHTFIHEMYEFFNAITKDKPTAPSFYDAMKCNQVLEAVEKSAAQGCYVKVDEI